MKKTFNTIGLIGRHRHDEMRDTFEQLLAFLQAQHKQVLFEKETAEFLSFPSIKMVEKNELGNSCDLIIVVGGDGSLLHAAHALAESQTPILGINRGRLGFLTDIRPNEIENKLSAIFEGHYSEESRFLLEASIQGQSHTPAYALNDIVLATGDAAHMIEFEVYVNNSFVWSERSDGLIISTPTGSTAYALSGGGPIIHPSLNAILLVSMFSHTLNSRPIVIPGDSQISIKLGQKTFVHSPRITADGEPYHSLGAHEEIHIRKKDKPLTLIHPADYNYFENVRSKLYWGQKL